MSKVGKVIPDIDESTIATVKCSNCFKDTEVNFIQYLTEVQMQGKSHSFICKKCKDKKGEQTWNITKRY